MTMTMALGLWQIFQDWTCWLLARVSPRYGKVYDETQITLFTCIRVAPVDEQSWRCGSCKTSHLVQQIIILLFQIWSIFLFLKDRTNVQPQLTTFEYFSDLQPWRGKMLCWPGWNFTSLSSLRILRSWSSLIMAFQNCSQLLFSGRNTAKIWESLLL